MGPPPPFSIFVGADMCSSRTVVQFSDHGRHVKSPICAVHCFGASMSCVSGDWFGFGALGFLLVVFRAFFFLGSFGLLLVSCVLGSATGSLVVYLVSLMSRITFNRSARPFLSKVQGTIDDFFSQSFVPLLPPTMSSSASTCSQEGVVPTVVEAEGTPLTAGIEEAAVEVLGQPVGLRDTEYQLYIDSLARSRGAPLEDHEIPGRCYLEGLIEQVDDGLLLTERLSDIISKKEEDEQRAVLGAESAPSVRPYLTILCKAVDLTGIMPTCHEELRGRYAIMGSAWEMIRLRSPSRPLLRDYTPAIFNKTLLGFLCGDKVYKYAGDLSVSSTASPTWPFIVHLEYTLREKVFKNIREYHLSLVQSINATINDQVFTSQVSPFLS